MKFVPLILLSIFTSAQPIELRLEDITSKVSSDNYLVVENAQRVYQKKENIKFSRASLMPKLNVWNLLKIPSVFVSPLAIGDIIQDVAPFLVPANWFNFSQSKYMYEIEKQQYKALWANEVNTAKLLFVSVYKDQEFLSLIEQKLSSYKVLMDIAQSRNIFGSGNIFAYRLIKDRYLSLVEDSRNLDNLVFDQVKSLQYIVGINNEEDVIVVTPTLFEIESAKKVEFSKIIFKAIEASPEVKQYEYLFNSLSKLKSKIKFSILGTSTYSLGEGNGAFDHIPIQDGLGFGLSASLRISKSEQKILKIQLDATKETLKKQVNILVKEYNSLISNYETTSQRVQLAQANYDAMITHLSVGGELAVMEMVEVIDNLYASKIVHLSYKTRFNDLVEKLKRITFSGDYANGPQLRIEERK